MIGPITNPMNRSMPDHISPDSTWTKFKNQSSSLAIAPTMIASASATKRGSTSKMRATGAVIGASAIIARTLPSTIGAL